MTGHCYSCGMGLSDEQRGADPNYCQWCVDPDGNLNPREEIHRGIASWLQAWGPNVTEDEAFERATLYMQSMPAWA